VVDFSIFRKVEDRFHPVSLKERIEQASFRLHAQLEKLEHMYTRLQQRDTELFQRCVGAQLSNDTGHAKIYANECAELRKIAKVVLGSQLALEKVILRLETVEEFGAIMTQMAPVMGIVKETKSKIAGIVPQVATELEEVNNMLGDLTSETGEVTANTIPIETTDSEARKVLEETGLIAEEKLREHFPVLPTMKAEQPEAVPELASPIPLMPDMEADIDQQVYEYARKHDGEMNIQSCAQELGASPGDVKVALERLRENGKVVVE
jgi:division protein CdvB (Snf7/Vps24/ESCRT-III family)